MFRFLNKISIYSLSISAYNSPIFPPKSYLNRRKSILLLLIILCQGISNTCICIDSNFQIFAKFLQNNRIFSVNALGVIEVDFIDRLKVILGFGGIRPRSSFQVGTFDCFKSFYWDYSKWIRQGERENITLYKNSKLDKIAELFLCFPRQQN